MAVDGETPIASSPRTLVCEPEEVEGFRTFLTAPLSIRRRKASEFQQARFPVMQLQPELGEARPELFQTGRRVETRQYRGFGSQYLPVLFAV